MVTLQSLPSSTRREGSPIVWEQPLLPTNEFGRQKGAVSEGPSGSLAKPDRHWIQLQHAHAREEPS